MKPVKVWLDAPSKNTNNYVDDKDVFFLNQKPKYYQTLNNDDMVYYCDREMRKPRFFFLTN